MQSLIFTSADSAYDVASYLYDCTQENNVLNFRRFDRAAVTTAIGLAGLTESDYMIEGAKCRLPFPRSERECKDSDIPKIYVACLSAYNNGMLHGIWIDATQDEDDIQADIDWMLSWSPANEYDSPCEEWAIHDYEGFEDISLSEWEDLETVSKLANTIEEHGKAFCIYYGLNRHDDIDSTIDGFSDSYLGQYKDAEDFVSDMWEQDGRLAQLEAIGVPYSYIDWSYVIGDMKCSGDYYFAEVGYEETYIFATC